MGSAARPVAPLLALLALLAPPAAGANVTGNVEVQSQTTQNVSQPGVGTTQSTFLMESLSLHYAGLPLGPDVAVATLGGAFSNVTSWLGRGLQTTGRILSFDASVGLLPRRALPLRLYASGSVDAGSSGVLVTTGGPSLLYGGTLNVEPGAHLPGLRLDASEGRSSRPGHASGSDVQRRVAASSYGTAWGQRLDLGLRLDDDHRDGAGDVTASGATLKISSAPHQTTLLASEVRRSIPTLGGITSDRQLGATSELRWSPALSTQLSGRLSEAGAGGATGRIGDARAAFTWVPVQGARSLTLSGGANAGFARTSAPGAEASGTSYGGAARVGHARPLGAFTASAGVGASASACDCGFGNDGTTTLLDATASLALARAARSSAQVEYGLAKVFAPLGRGGDRLESHARATGRLALGAESSVNAGLGWDDDFRELIDLTAGRAASLHERTITGSLGGATRAGGLSLSGETRHTRGRVVTDASPFVASGAKQVRSITSLQASAGWSPRHDVGLQAQAIGTFTELHDAPAIQSYGANAGVVWRLGRITLSAQYQAFRYDLRDVPASFQHSIRTALSRPFDL